MKKILNNLTCVDYVLDCVYAIAEDLPNQPALTVSMQDFFIYSQIKNKLDLHRAIVENRQNELIKNFQKVCANDLVYVDVDRSRITISSH